MQFHNGHAPYRIETPRTRIRCWDPHDARKLQEAIDASVESLLPWMPWAKGEPKDYRTKVQLLRRFRGDFDLDYDYVYGIFTKDEREVIGGCGLHTRAGEYALEIGYWINQRYQNRGFATEAAEALLRTAFEFSDIDNVQIKCASDNAASLRVMEKVGFQIEGTLRRRAKDANDEFQDLVVGIYLRSEFEGGPLDDGENHAYDAADTALT